MVTLPIKRPILVCTMCHTRSWAMLLRIEEHLSFQKGIALAGACTPYHVVTLKPPSNSHGQFTWSMHLWEGIICVPCCKGQSKYRNKSTIHLESSRAYGNYEMLYPVPILLYTGKQLRKWKKMYVKCSISDRARILPSKTQAG